MMEHDVLASLELVRIKVGVPALRTEETNSSMKNRNRMCVLDVICMTRHSVIIDTCWHGNCADVAWYIKRVHDL